jgi:hypothetical protein
VTYVSIRIQSIATINQGARSTIALSAIALSAIALSATAPKRRRSIAATAITVGPAPVQYTSAAAYAHTRQ